MKQTNTKETLNPIPYSYTSKTFHAAVYITMHVVHKEHFFKMFLKYQYKYKI